MESGQKKKADFRGETTGENLTCLVFFLLGPFGTRQINPKSEIVILAVRQRQFDSSNETLPNSNLTML